MPVKDTLLEKKYSKLNKHLNERTRRLIAAADAEYIGHGGVTVVSAASGLSRVAITKGKKELKEPVVAFISPTSHNQRVRKEGGGRKRFTEKESRINQVLEELINPHTLGDPESPLLWTSKSLRKLSEELSKQGYKISYVTVGALLKEMGYSLQANRKTHEGVVNHPDRDAQFQYINEQSKRFIQEGHPVISVDTKKKELVGNFKNKGMEWLPSGQPQDVNVYDFPSLADGKAIPYGVYDVERNVGWVNVGTDSDTPMFAVESIKGWWYSMGKPTYKTAGKLLIHADSGGSNSARSRVWKKQLQELANQTRLSITVSHLPPGTSKWNKIEHRMFSQISINWRGKPLTSFETIINLIGATTTEKGLKIKANLDCAKYAKGIKVSDKEMKKINLEKHSFHGEWNYTITPDYL